MKKVYVLFILLSLGRIAFPQACTPYSFPFATGEVSVSPSYLCSPGWVNFSISNANHNEYDYNFKWVNATSNTVLSGNSQNLAVYVTATTSFQISTLDFSGCESYPIFIDVSVIAPQSSPINVNNASVCGSNSTAYLAISNSTSTNYKWYYNGTLLPSGQTSYSSSQLSFSYDAYATFLDVTNVVTSAPSFTISVQGEQSTQCGMVTTYGSSTITVHNTQIVLNLPETIDNTSNLNLVPLATPANGTWSGNGVSNNNFSTYNLAAGIQWLTYTYTDSYGCTTQKSKSIMVVPPPCSPYSFPFSTEEISISPGAICSPGWVAISIANANHSEYDYNFKWVNTTSNTVLPGTTSNLSIYVDATTSLEVTAISSANCSSYPVTINLPIITPQVSPIAVNNSSLCANSGTAYLSISNSTSTNYKWFYNGIPLPAGQTSYSSAQLSFSYDAYATFLDITNVVTSMSTFSIDVQGQQSTPCGVATTYGTATIAVHATPLGLTLPETICDNLTAFNLTSFATPLNGTWSGTGVSANKLNTSMAGVGTRTLTYTYTDVYGCANVASGNVTINHLDAPVTEDKSIPYNTSAILAASGAGVNETYRWYNESEVFLKDAATYKTENLSQGITRFKVSKINASLSECESTEKSTIVVTAYYPYNYIKERTALISGIATTEDMNARSVTEKNMAIVYYDGLGRPMQNVSKQASPNDKMDIVTPMVYDSYGRENKKYLPYISVENNGEYKNDAVTAVHNFYSTASNSIPADTKPFAETSFEPTPLNRVLKQGAPGSAWQPNTDIYSKADNSLKKRYELNVSEEVFLFKYDETTGSVSAMGAERYYPPNQLYANKTYDEKNNEIIEYIDKKGQVVCKKVYTATENNVKQYASTYYLYDDFGNLVLVIPPEGLVRIKTLTGN